MPLLGLRILVLSFPIFRQVFKAFKRGLVTLLKVPFLGFCGGGGGCPGGGGGLSHYVLLCIQPDGSEMSASGVFLVFLKLDASQNFYLFGFVSRGVRLRVSSPKTANLKSCRS